jgi:uncharacterized protein
VSIWQPVQASERYTTLDLLRGFSLFGVLLVNLLYFFRVSLFAHILQFHSHEGWVNHTVDLLVKELLEFKAFDLFSLTFGISVALQAERAHGRGVNATLFLIRRFLILLAFGLVHMLLISNVDILCLYAVCGFLLIPLLRLPTWMLAVLGLCAIFLPSALRIGPPFPSEPVLHVHALEATRIYSEGSFGEILVFRWHETREFMLPLLIGVAQKTFGMMLLGVALWRSGVVRNPQHHRRLLWAVCLATAAVGIYTRSHVPIAFAYGAALLAWDRSGHPGVFMQAVAAAGRMALSNYLAQSILFALVFYGYGLALFGKLAPAPAAAFGVAVYAGQLAFSVWWLNRYRFGPFEWVWRSLTYGRRQPMSLSRP